MKSEPPFIKADVIPTLKWMENNLPGILPNSLLMKERYPDNYLVQVALRSQSRS